MENIKKKERDGERERKRKKEETGKERESERKPGVFLRVEIFSQPPIIM